MNYVVIAKERAQFHLPSSWQVSRWVEGQGTFLGRHLPADEAKLIAERDADGLPVREWMECVLCGKKWPESFMVLDKVWHEAKLGRGVVHITCLETLLGRKLTPEDFNLDLPINSVLAFGLQMARSSP
jgi:hypothetical protein